MITRLKISGFKNLVETDIAFGPVTCIAGPNSVGKSNLFDAIKFLSDLADRPLLEAAAAVRSDVASRSASPTKIFHQVGDEVSPAMIFEVEMLVPPKVPDDLGQIAEATNTLLRYSLVLRRRGPSIAIEREALDYVSKRDAPRVIKFPHTPRWRTSVVRGKRRGKPFISSDTGTDQIFLHQDGAPGRPRPYLASTLPRTVLSTANAAEARTATVAHLRLPIPI